MLRKDTTISSKRNARIVSWRRVATRHTEIRGTRARSKQARLAQSVERLALNQVVVGSSPTVGASFLRLSLFCSDTIL